MTATFLTLILLGPVQAADKKDKKDKSDDSKLPKQDHKFIMSAAAGGLLEVELGQLAQTNASSPDVKAFGQHMVTDHSKANDQLKKLAASKGVTLPDKLPKQQQETYDHRAKLKGKDFDKEYMKLMVDNHRRDINEFEDESKHGQDPDLKSFATNTLPTLREHHRMAKDIAKKVGVDMEKDD